MNSIYLIEMDIERKQRDLARGAEQLRLRSMIDVPPSPLRRAVASAIVRIGMFLNGNRYCCPDADAAMRAEAGARPTG